MVYMLKAHLLEDYVKEAIASTMYVFLCLAVVALNGGSRGYETNTSQPIIVALGLGIALALTIHCFPTAHINLIYSVAITIDRLRAAALGKISWLWALRGIGNCIIIIITGIFGSLLVWGLIDQDATDLGLPEEGSEIKDWRLVVALLYTGLGLTFVFMSSLNAVAPLYKKANESNDHASSHYGTFTRSISNGLALAVLALITYSVSGANDNPMRALGAAIVSNTYNHDLPWMIFALFFGMIVGYAFYVLVALVSTSRYAKRVGKVAKKASDKSKKRVLNRGFENM